MPSKKVVEEFISSYHLRKADNTVIFNALISFHRDSILHKVPSRVQVISLPDAMALYIDEFFHDGYHQPELYSTEDFYFTRTGNGIEIRGFESQPEFLVSIMLIG